MIFHRPPEDPYVIGRQLKSLRNRIRAVRETHLDLLVKLLDDDLSLDLVSCSELTTFRSPQLSADDNVLQEFRTLETGLLSSREQLLLEVLLDLLVLGQSSKVSFGGDVVGLQVVSQVAFVLLVVEIRSD